MTKTTLKKPYSGDSPLSGSCWFNVHQFYYEWVLYLRVIN
jgi:hypothetical protein